MSIKRMNKHCRNIGFGVFLSMLLFGYIETMALIEDGLALECTDGAVSSAGVCDTDMADVHVSVEGGWAISVSSAGTLGVDVSPTNSGVLSTVVDSVNVYTNIPTGHQLYLNSTSGSTDIYNNDLLDKNGNLSANLLVGTNTNHFTATTGTKDAPAVLSNNTWGYSLDTAPAVFAKVALTSDDVDSRIYTNPTKTSSSGDNIPVTYGFRADNSLAPGTYSTSVTYTAIADVPTYTIDSVSPSELKIDDQIDKTITIMASTPATELAFGEVSAKIGTVDLTDCIEIASGGYRGVTCTYDGALPAGSYDVSLTSSWHNATYTLNNGFIIRNIYITDLEYMQDITSTICANTPTHTTARLKDSRGMGNGGSDKTSTYGVVKAADGNCWMTDNLNLYNITVSSTASDFNTGSYKIPAGITKNTDWNSNIYTKPMVEVAHGLGQYATKDTKYYGQVYYNWTAAVAMTNGTTTKSQNTSICPKNWQLPVDLTVEGATDTDVNIRTDKTWAKLMNSYGVSSGSDLLNTKHSSYELGFRLYYGDWRQISASEYGQGSRGYFWTNAPDYRSDYKSYQSIHLYYDASNVIGTYLNSRGHGCSIRCVAR